MSSSRAGKSQHFPVSPHYRFHFIKSYYYLAKDDAIYILTYTDANAEGYYKMCLSYAGEIHIPEKLLPHFNCHFKHYWINQTIVSCIIFSFSLQIAMEDQSWPISALPIDGRRSWGQSREVAVPGRAHHKWQRVQGSSPGLVLLDPVTLTEEHSKTCWAEGLALSHTIGFGAKPELSYSDLRTPASKLSQNSPTAEEINLEKWSIIEMSSAKK